MKVSMMSSLHHLIIDQTLIISIDRVIIASGLADQSYLHIFKRSLSGWSISNPEKINLSSILRSDGNFVDKNFTGFSHMVYVTVSLINFFREFKSSRDQFSERLKIRIIDCFEKSFVRCNEHFTAKTSVGLLTW